MSALVGVAIGGTKCTLATWDMDDAPREVLRLATSGPRETIAELKAAIYGTCGDKAAVIGISCGGPLDEEAGRILSPPNLPGWDDVPIRDLLSNHGQRTHLMNDANAGAIAEWRYGAAKGAAHAVFLTFGSGMGAGLILNDRLYEGADHFAGEVGHWRLAPAGPEGFGKPGSFEGFCSGNGVLR